MSWVRVTLLLLVADDPLRPPLLSPGVTTLLPPPPVPDVEPELRMALTLALMFGNREPRAAPY